MLTVIDDQIECPEHLQSAPGHDGCRRHLANNPNLFGRSHLDARYDYVYPNDVSDTVFSIKIRLKKTKKLQVSLREQRSHTFTTRGFASEIPFEREKNDVIFEPTTTKSHTRNDNDERPINTDAHAALRIAGPAARPGTRNQPL